MKQILYTLLLFCAIALCACRKNKNQPDIKQFDDQQIQNYISSHGLTGMQRDLSSGDTTGIYYKIIETGDTTQPPIDYPDSVSLVFTLSSFDGKFISADTIANHVDNFLGHITQNSIPKGVELALLNILKYKGGKMRLLIPSHLAYGSVGFGSGSSSSNNRIAGNQCLDYYVNLIDDQGVYDDQVIKNYLTAQNLTGYTALAVGKDTLDKNNHKKNYVYYKILQPGVGAPITTSSSVTIQYTSSIFDGIATSDTFTSVDGTGSTITIADDVRRGLTAALLHTLPGSKISIILPSGLGYGANDYSDSSIPVNSCLRYEVSVISAQ